MASTVGSVRTADGVTLGVEQLGDPSAPLVLLVGSPTMLSWPDRLFEALAHGGRHVVRYDLRDAGASTTVDPEAPAYTLRDLAADAAVLDYSSLRFDVALAGVPSAFLVPDLEEYARGTRQFLYPFEDSAPGPLVATTAEVVERLHDLPGLRAAWRPALEEFNARYHPFQDGAATARVVDGLLAMLPPGPA